VKRGTSYWLIIVLCAYVAIGGKYCLFIIFMIHVHGMMNCVGAKCDETKIEGSINKLCAFSCILELEESKRNCDSCEQKVNQMEARNMTFSNGKSSQ